MCLRNFNDYQYQTKFYNNMYSYWCKVGTESLFSLTMSDHTRLLYRQLSICSHKNILSSILQRLLIPHQLFDRLLDASRSTSRKSAESVINRWYSAPIVEKGKGMSTDCVLWVPLMNFFDALRKLEKFSSTSKYLFFKG